MRVDTLPVPPVSASCQASVGSLHNNCTQKITQPIREVSPVMKGCSKNGVDPLTVRKRRSSGRKRVDSLPCLLHLQQPHHALLDRPAAADRDEGCMTRSKKGSNQHNQSRSVCDTPLTLVLHDSNRNNDSNGIVANKEWISATMPGSGNKNHHSDGKDKVTSVMLCSFKVYLDGQCKCNMTDKFLKRNRKK